MPRHLVVGVNSDESVLQASLAGLLVRGAVGIEPFVLWVGRSPKQNQRLQAFLGKGLQSSSFEIE